MSSPLLVPDIASAPGRLAEFLSANQPVLALSGAGISTASGIGDYRDRQGVYKRPPPATIQQFLASPEARQRYWARSLHGWPAFSQAQPNAGHRALAQLAHQGLVGALITQNVDGLHQRAGHQRVLELHGNLHRVVCLSCGAANSRAALQTRLEQANQHLLGQSARLAPDGDADLSQHAIGNVVVPECDHCGGVLKPDVVFFGDSVPQAMVSACYQQVRQCKALLILGSSVMIHSSFRFCRRARQAGLPLAAVNVGRTRADKWLTLKIEQPCERVLPGLTGGQTR